MSDVYREFESLEYLEVDVDEKVFDNIVESLSYQGFSAKVLLEKIKNATPVSVKAQDIASMVVLGLLRGNNMDKMMRKMSKEGIKIVTELRKNYGLVLRTKQADSLTLSRVVNLFPGIACSFANDKQKSFPVSPSMLKAALEYKGDIPSVLCCPAFGNIIPSSDTKTFKLSITATAKWTKAFCLYQAALSVVLTRTKDKQTPLNKKTIKEAIAKVHTFVGVAVGAEYPSQETRFKIIQKFNLVAGYDENKVLKSTRRIGELADIYDELVNAEKPVEEEKKDSNNQELD